jgi:uncharacterized membrane protein YhaH (DUF805 family)
MAFESCIMPASAGPAQMQSLSLFLSPSGRIGPRAFVVAVIGLYLVALASQALTAAGIIAQAGLWPFAVAQFVLLWVWFVLHAKRMRDAGHGAGTAAGVAVVYGLALLLFLIAATWFFALSDTHGDDPNTTSALTVLLALYIFAILFGRPDFGIVWFVMSGMLVVALLPVLIALGFSLWAATRPSLPGRLAERTA